MTSRSARRGVGLDLAVHQDDHPVAQRLDLGQDVGREEDRWRCSASRRIRRRISTICVGSRPDGRLVQDQQLGLVQDGLGQADALAEALAELADGPGQVLGQAGGVDRLGDARQLLAGRDLRAGRPSSSDSACTDSSG